jgi:hypothetical protein
MKIIKDIPGQFSCPGCALRAAKSCRIEMEKLGLPDCAKEHIHFQDEPDEFDPQILDPDMKIFNTSNL